MLSVIFRRLLLALHRDMRLKLTFGWCLVLGLGLMGCIGDDVVPEPKNSGSTKEKIELSGVEGDTLFLEVGGEKKRLIAKYFDAEGKENSTQALAWHSSDEKIAKVSASGEVSPVSQGQAHLFAHKQGDMEGVKSRMVIAKVDPDPKVPTDISISARNTTKNVDNAMGAVVGDKLQFSAVVRNYKKKVLEDITLAWESSAADKLSIDASSGVATALAVGSAKVKAKYGETLSSNEVLINVVATATEAASVEFDPAGQGGNMSLNEMKTLTVVVKDVGQMRIASPTITCTSSDAGVLSVAGLKVTAKKVGTASVTCTSGMAKSAPLAFEVKDENQVVKIVVSSEGNQKKLEPRQTLQLSAVAKNFKDQNVSSATFTWSSTDAGVATVSDGGLVTAVAEGMVMIKATSGGVSGAFEITVQSAEAAKTSWTGTFSSSGGYTVRGTVMLVKNSDNSHTLTFGNDTQISRGPGVVIRLAANKNDAKRGGNHHEVGTPKSYSGMQSYTIPSSVDLEGKNWVVIHCKPANLIFGFAELR